MTDKTIWCLKQAVSENEKRYMPGWWSRDDRLQVWRNSAGGWHSMGADTDTIIYVTVECDQFDDFWTAITPEQRIIIQKLAKERLTHPDATSGWVTPSGEWFPCGHYNHDKFAFHFFGQPVAHLERSHARVKGRFWSIEGGLISTAMSQRLKRMGFVDDDGELCHYRHLDVESTEEDDQ